MSVNCTLHLHKNVPEKMAIIAWYHILNPGYDIDTLAEQATQTMNKDLKASKSHFNFNSHLNIPSFMHSSIQSRPFMVFKSSVNEGIGEGANGEQDMFLKAFVDSEQKKPINVDDYNTAFLTGYNLFNMCILKEIVDLMGGVANFDDTQDQFYYNFNPKIKHYHYYDSQYLDSIKQAIANTIITPEKVNQLYTTLYEKTGTQYNNELFGRDMEQDFNQLIDLHQKYNQYNQLKKQFSNKTNNQQVNQQDNQETIENNDSNNVNNRNEPSKKTRKKPL